MALKDAVLTIDEATGEVRVSVKKPDNVSGSFFCCRLSIGIRR